MDVHADRVEVAQDVVHLKCAQRIHHELRVICGIHGNAHAVLQIDDRQVAIGNVDDDGVAGACGSLFACQVIDRHLALGVERLALSQIANELDVVGHIVSHGLVDRKGETVDLHDVAYERCRISVVYQALRRDVVRHGALCGVDAAAIRERCLKANTA